MAQKITLSLDTSESESKWDSKKFDSIKTPRSEHNVSIEKRAWNFLPAAKIKAGNCLKGEVLIIVLLYLHKFACN